MLQPSLTFLVTTALAAAAFVTVTVVLARRRLPRGSRFGAANGVTLARLVLLAPLVGLLGAEPSPTRAWLGIAISGPVLALDYVDGWLARRHGTASDFGARFDMETDALLILLLSVLCPPANVRSGNPAATHGMS